MQVTSFGRLYFPSGRADNGQGIYPVCELVDFSSIRLVSACAGADFLSSHQKLVL